MNGRQNENIKEVIKYYHLLFKFPFSHGQFIVLTFTLTFLLSAIAHFLTFKNLILSLAFGAGIVLASMISILFAYEISKDQIFSLRRCVTIFFINMITLEINLYIGTLLNVFLEMFLLGLCFTALLWYIFLYTMSFSNPISNLIISVIIPFFYILLALPFFDILHLKYILPLLASLALFLIADVIILQIVDRYGISKIGVKSTSLLKAFLAVWLEKNSKPIEDHFNKIGKNEQVSIGIIGFKKGGKLKGIIIVPKIHPGPFLNVGSSNLPFIIQRTLEDNYKTVAAIAHGISSHELDLTSTKEVEITVKELLKIITAAQNQLYTTATRLIRVEYGSAKTTCQIFGEAALVTLTLAPKEMDDLPQEIEIEIAKYGKELGLKEVLVIDAHNSILTKFPTLNDEDINNLKISAQQAIAKCVLEPRFEFKLGISKIVPNEFVSVLNIGVAGIVTMIVEVNNQKIAYIVIDGNNMFSGLREDIIRALTKQNIIDDAEILTSDSHIGSAIDLSAIGYHPVGEGIDREKLIHYIEQTVIEATSNMQPVKLFHGSTVFDAKVLGRKNLKELTSLVGYSISKFIISLILIMIPIIVIAIFLFFPSILGLKI